MSEVGANIVLKTYNFPTSKIEFWENGLVCIEIQPDSEINLELSKAHYQTLKDNYTQQYYVLADPGKFTTLTKEARDFSSKPETNAMTNAVAVIIHSLAQRIILNFHAKFISKQKMKMKGFSTKELAIKWLNDLKGNNVN